MKIEEAMPEIRKGRRWRILGEDRWQGPLNERSFIPVCLGSEFELEPELNEIRPGVFYKRVDGNINSGIQFEWCVNGEMSDLHTLYLSHTEIDALHAASLEARGIDKVPSLPNVKPLDVEAAWEKFKEENDCHTNWNYPIFKAAYRLGENDAFSVIDDSLTAQSENPPKYVELSDEEAEELYWTNGQREPVILLTQRIHRAGWDQRDKSQ